MKTRNLLGPMIVMAALIVNTNSCKDEEVQDLTVPDLNCDTYFLTSVSSIDGGATFEGLRYNANGKLVSLYSYGGLFGSALYFHYDENQRIQTTSTYSFGDRVDYFVFDGKDRLITTYADLSNPAFGTIRSDSLTFEYDASGRVSKVNSFEFKYPATLEYKRYKTFAYSGNQVTVKIYYFESTWSEAYNLVFTMDSNPNPYPIEYYYAQVRRDAVIFPEHNVMLGPATYNDDGYPTKIGDLKFTYSCTPQ